MSGPLRHVRASKPAEPHRKKYTFSTANTFETTVTSVQKTKKTKKIIKEKKKPPIFFLSTVSPDIARLLFLHVPRGLDAEASGSALVKIQTLQTKSVALGLFRVLSHWIAPNGQSSAWKGGLLHVQRQQRLEMDQTGLPPNTSGSMPSNSDYLMSEPSDRWTLHPHTSPLSPWHTQPLPLGSAYFAHGHIPESTPPDSIPAQFAQTRQHSALPHPDRSLRALQNPELVAGPPAAPIWALGSHPISGMAHYVSGASYGMTMAPVSSGSPPAVNEPAHADSGMRGPALESQSAAVWEASGATSTSLSTTPRFSPSSGRPRNVSDSFAASPSSTMLPYPPNPISLARPTQIPSPSSQITATNVESRGTSGLTSSTSDRRRHAPGRARRPTGSRQSESGLFGILDEADAGQSSRALVDEMLTCHVQVFRGSASSKMVASRAAIYSFERLETCTLAENEKTCVICYNDYGVASPEGVIEVAVRLPDCKHDMVRRLRQLPVLSKQTSIRIEVSSRVGKNILDHDEVTGDTVTPGVSCVRPLPIVARKADYNLIRLLDGDVRIRDALRARLATGQLTYEEYQDLISQGGRPAERRPPPDDNITQEQRRTRQRRNGPVSEDNLLTDDGGAAHTRPTNSDTPSRRLPTSTWELVSAESSWAAQLTMPDSAPSSASQEQGQPRSATGEESVQNNTLGTDRGQTASARTVTRPTDPAAPVVVNGSSMRERSTPNPLLSRLHPSSVAPTATAPGSYRASNPSTTDNPTQRPAGPELSPFQPSRIRPW
ncbi:hypothetical protein E4U53_005012 [Claviceps sorghi]|nr:hypothetical protein E4U53_005012 [Claviceps sorghi]